MFPQWYYLGGAIALSGCNKNIDAVQPVAAQLTHNLEGYHLPSDEEIQQQREWLWYLEKLESGEATDPTGQYLSKETQFEGNEAEGQRQVGPKVSAHLAQTDYGFNEYRAINGTGTTSQPPCTDCLTLHPPSHPGFGAGTGNGSGSNHGGGVVAPGQPTYPPPTTVFVSTEGLAPYSGSNNPNGYVYDLKVAKGGSPNVSVLSGYTKLNLDLNKGAGGRYIYLTFTRNPGDVQLGDETGYGWARSETEGPVVALQAFTTFTGISIGWIFGATPIRPFLPIWARNPIPGSTWKHPDLNDGSRGFYIYGFQFKDPNQHPVPVEIGIIASNFDHPVPPAGWHADYTQDLNERAGGDYIYFCTKDR